MKKTLSGLVLVAGLTLVPACAAETASAEKPAPKVETEQEKTLYALGVWLGNRVSQFRLSAEELAVVQAGLADVTLKHALKADLDTYGPKLNELAESRGKMIAKENEDAGKAACAQFLAANKDAKKMGSGLILLSTQEGTGKSPVPSDRITVNYTGKLLDGTVFDSSEKSGHPATFSLTQVIPCWVEAFQFLKVGGKAKLYCPADIAYGEQGRPGIPPGATLVFDVELLGIEGK